MIEKPLKQALKLIVSLLVCVTSLHSISFTESKTYAQESSFVAAWIFNGQLWVSDGTGDAELLSEGFVLQATLSPNEDYIAAILNRGTNPDDLLVIFEVETGESVLQVESEMLPITENEQLSFSRPIWINESTIWFNTIALFEGPPGFENRYDIHEVDLEGNIIERFAAGTGGDIILSPDREKVAITRAGDYQNPNQLSMIQIIDVDNGNPLSNVFEFPAVATGSEITWSPTIQWNTDSTSIVFAIPTPDLIYATDSLPPSQICRLSVEDSVICSDEEISYPAQPVWNDDLTRIAFERQIFNSDNLNSREIIFGEYTAEGTLNLVRLRPDENLPQPLLWLDDDKLLFQKTFSPPPNLYYASLESQDFQIWQPDGHTILNLQRLNETTFLASIGEYAEITVSIYDLEQNTFYDLGTYRDGFVNFVMR